MKYTDELESGRRERAHGLSLAEEIQIYRQDLLKKVSLILVLIIFICISFRSKKKKNKRLIHLQIHQNRQIELQTDNSMNHHHHLEIVHHDILNNEASKRKVRECDVRKFLFSLTYAK